MDRSQPRRETWRRDRPAALQYERSVVPILMGPWAADLVEAVSPQAGERVLDVACGTGLVARLAARQVGVAGRVTGLDLVPEMLEVARTVLPGVGPPIEWCEGDAASLPFPDGSFDAVFCHQGLQFFTDRAAALREIRRVLAPAGRIALAVWSRIERNPYFLAVAEAVGRRVATEAGAQLRSPFALGDPGELEALLGASGLGNSEVRPVGKSLRLPLPKDFVPSHLAGTSLAAEVAATEPAARAALIQDVAAELRSYLDPEGMTPPFEILLAVWRSRPGGLDGARQFS